MDNSEKKMVSTLAFLVAVLGILFVSLWWSFLNRVAEINERIENIVDRSIVFDVGRPPTQDELYEAIAKAFDPREDEVEFSILEENGDYSLHITTGTNYWGGGAMFGSGGVLIKNFRMTKNEMRSILDHVDRRK